ncbi:hypothetical protein J6E39_09185 [bacterium]|nr:hypothetical protein [bacterium]
MKNKLVLMSSIVMLAAMVGVNAAELEPVNPPDGAAPASLETTTKFDTNTVYYPGANLKSAISKYKKHNYTGCIQELLSLVKKNPSNADAYYYLALAYTQIGDGGSAMAAYDKVISLSRNPGLLEYAKKGKDCLVGGPLCNPIVETASDAVEGASQAETELDRFINAPYGDGVSPEVNKQLRQKELNSIHNKINTKDELNIRDIQQIEEFDKGSDASGEISDGIKIASADVSDEDVLSAIKTLRAAGMTVNVQPSAANNQPNSYYQSPEYAAQSNEMAQWNAMFGNNNRSNDSFANMLPYIMNADGTPRKDINPQMLQTMMMNSSMLDFNFNNDNR